MGATYSKSIYDKYCEHCNEKYKIRTMNGGCHAMCIIYYEDHICKNKNIQSNNPSRVLVII